MAKSAQGVEPKSNRTFWLVASGIGCTGVVFAVSCVCGCGFWIFYPWGGVSRGDKDSILEEHRLNRAPGRENDLLYDSWEGIETKNHQGAPVRVVRVQYHLRGMPELKIDELHDFRGIMHNSLQNPFGDRWKTEVVGLDWDKARRKQIP